jgi:MFS family permease
MALAPGIYGVVVISLAADLTWGKGRFNTLTGLFATAVAIGGIVGPVLGGIGTQRTGFKATFLFFSVLAVVGASAFTILVPETKPSSSCGAADTRHAAKFEADRA